MTLSVNRFGFREVELVQEEVDDADDGALSFYFKVNDKKIFAKGANWIPADAFHSRVTAERLVAATQKNRRVPRNRESRLFRGI